MKFDPTPNQSTHSQDSEVDDSDASSAELPTRSQVDTLVSELDEIDTVLSQLDQD